MTLTLKEPPILDASTALDADKEKEEGREGKNDASCKRRQSCDQEVKNEPMELPSSGQGAPPQRPSRTPVTDTPTSESDINVSITCLVEIYMNIM